MSFLDLFIPAGLRQTANWNDPSGTSFSGPAANFWYNLVGAYAQTNAGVTVTNDRALSLAAYFACLRNISEDIAKLPLNAYEILTPRGKKRLPDHVAFLMLGRRPNRQMGGYTFRETLQGWALGWGNGYSSIERSGRNEIKSLTPIHPARVIVKRASSGTIITPSVDVGSNDDIVYEVRPPAGDPDGRTVTFARDEIFHIKGLGGDGLMGYPVLQYAAETIGGGLAQQKYGNSVFGSGGIPAGVLTHPGKLSDTAGETIREAWKRKFAGKAEVAILREGMKYEKVSMAPEEAQFLQTRTFTVQEIARFFRMPLGKIQEDSRSTFSNVEQKGQEYVDDTLMPWICRWEQEAALKLDMADDECIEFDVRSLLRGDHNARANFWRTMLNLGVMSPNDIREAESMNPIDDPAANEYYMMTNMASLDQIAEGESAPGVTKNQGGNIPPAKEPTNA